MTKGIVAEPLLEEDLVLVVAPGHRLARRRSVGLGELRDEPFVLYRPGSGTRNLVVEACRREGFDPIVAFESDAARALAAGGVGVAVVPRSTAELGGLELRVLRLHPPAQAGGGVLPQRGSLPLPSGPGTDGVRTTAPAPRRSVS